MMRLVALLRAANGQVLFSASRGDRKELTGMAGSVDEALTASFRFQVEQNPASDPLELPKVVVDSVEGGYIVSVVGVMGAEPYAVVREGKDLPAVIERAFASPLQNKMAAMLAPGETIQ